MGFETTSPITIGNVARKTDVDKIHGNTVLLHDGKTPIVLGEVIPFPLTPSTLVSGNTNNWDPTGLHVADGTAGASIIRLTAHASGSTLTSIQAPLTGQRLICLVKVGGGTFTLQNQSAVGSATPANKVITGSGADLTIATDQAVWLWYDDSTTRWRVIAKGF